MITEPMEALKTTLSMKTEYSLGGEKKRERVRDTEVEIEGGARPFISCTWHTWQL